MAHLTTPISQRIIDQLDGGEKRILSLVVGVRKSMTPIESVKGDLTAQVKSALNRLILDKKVVEADGMFSLKHSK